MRRTNLYLDDRQTSALDRRARAEGISRAELVRQLIDRGLGGVAEDVDSDLAAIEESFGAVPDSDWEVPARDGLDDRAAHLDMIRAR